MTGKISRARAEDYESAQRCDSARIVILTHYFWPEYADFKNMELAQALVQRGHEVTVLAPFPNYPTGRIYEGYKMRWRTWEYVDGVRILRLPLIPNHSTSGVGRMANYLSFSVAAATVGVALVGGTDLVFVYSPPMTLGVPAWLLKRLRGAKVLLDVVDIWPDAIVASGMSKSRLVPWMGGLLARQSYRTADKITTMTAGFLQRIRETGARRATPIEIRLPWAPAGISQRERNLEFGQRYGLEDCFCVIHAGNLGVSQDTDNLIAAATLLKVKAPEVRLVLVGAGRNFDRVVSQVAELGLDNVVVTGLHPQEEIPGILAWADACLISLASDPYLGINIPSKLATYLSAARPVIAVATGDLKGLIEATGVGIVVEPGNALALASAIERFRDTDASIREQMGRAAQATFDQLFEHDKVLSQTVADCESLIIEQISAPDKARSV